MKEMLDIPKFPFAWQPGGAHPPVIQSYEYIYLLPSGPEFT